ncbi:MAG TPA: HEPN domain-containing protein [Bacillota bacterium]|nr:HEPN domain-containing protein [Bacillota bacterium]
MNQQRYFRPVSLIKFPLGPIRVDYPNDVFRLYLSDYAPKYIRQIISKWQHGKELTERDYYQLIKKVFGNPYRGRILPDTADISYICGIEVKNGRLVVLEDAKQEIELKTLRSFLEQMLTPYTEPILAECFPDEQFNLGYWQELLAEDKGELEFNIKIAYIFTLYNYLWDQEARERYRYFPDYYTKEFGKRVRFIKRMWENRKPGEGLEYIPIFENFRNLNVEKGAFMVQMLSRILRSQNVQSGEKKIIEEALIKHAQALANCRDEEATQLKNRIINPVVSELVSLNKCQEFLHAAQLCLDNQLFNSALNRCYYAMLRACRAALVNFGYCKPWRGDNLRPVESHDEVLASFQRILVEEKGLFPMEQLGVLRRVLQKRLVADYADLEIKPGEAGRIFRQAQLFISKIEEIIVNN